MITLFTPYKKIILYEKDCKCYWTVILRFNNGKTIEDFYEVSANFFNLLKKFYSDSLMILNQKSHVDIMIGEPGQFKSDMATLPCVWRFDEKILPIIVISFGDLNRPRSKFNDVNELVLSHEK